MIEELKELENLAVELQEHITLPVHGDIRLKMFELVRELNKKNLEFEQYLDRKIDREPPHLKGMVYDVKARFKKKFV
jgi:hypothetical protein